MRPLSLVLNFLQSWSFPATLRQGSWHCLQAFMVPQTSRAPGTHADFFHRVPEFDGRGLELWLSLWLSSLGRHSLLSFFGRTLCHLGGPFGCCCTLPRVLLQVAVEHIFSLWQAVAVIVERSFVVGCCSATWHVRRMLPLHLAQQFFELTQLCFRVSTVPFSSLSSPSCCSR